jgi:predicted DNA-binding protein with PD1-like motif
MNAIPFRLHSGEDMHGAILALCRERGVDAGFIVSGIGMLEDPELGFLTGPAEYARMQARGRYELLTLTGNIALLEGNPHAHLHVVLGKPDYSTLGGHLFAARVGVTVEGCLLAAGEPWRMERRFEEASGLPGLVVSG